MKTLRIRIVLSFSALLLLTIGALSLVFNFTIDGLFEKYAYHQREQQIKQIIKQVNALYIPSLLNYNIEGLELIGNAALQNGIIIHVQTINREIDWDISTHKSQECQLMLQNAEKNMHSRYPSFNGGYEQETFDLLYQGSQVGYLTIGYYGPYSLDDNELQLLDSLNKVLSGLGIVFLLSAIALGGYVATYLSKPIRTVVNATQEIAKGSYGTQINEKFNTIEVIDLISSVNEMSMALKVKDQQKRQMTADVAHELRTPLTNLQSHMEAIIDEIWEPTPDLIQSCHAEILRLTNIVNQLLELSQLEDCKIILNKDMLSVYEFIDGLFRDFVIAAKDKGITLNVDILNSSAYIFADVNRLKECMVNLIANAIQFTPRGGTITILYRTDAYADYLEVKDTGFGISPDDLPNLFERFYRVEKSRNQRTGGMGIGLSITKAIVDVHGGSISVQSAMGKGSTFTIALPKAPFV